MIAKTFGGLEEVLAEEIKGLGAKDIVIGKRMVSFRGDKRLLYESNFRLRTALRILIPFYELQAKDPDDLYRKLVSYPWEKIFSVDQTFSIDTVAFSSSFSHSKFAGYKVKDAIVDYFRANFGRRPNVRLDNPYVKIHLHISEQNVSLSLDSSGESLHKRGYRVAQTPAPINEVLAAGILQLAGWKGETNFLDPMCGSGTFLIEAALIARNISPGIYNRGYAFQRWDGYDASLFDEIYNDDSYEKEFNHKIIGADLSATAVAVTTKNVKQAGLATDISLSRSSFETLPPPQEPLLIVTNPPYGERLKVNEINGLYERIGERLKHHYTGATAWIIGDKPEFFAAIGLKPSNKVSLNNGGIICQLRSYELFSGKHKDRKAQKAGSTSDVSREKHQSRKKLTNKGESSSFRRTRKKSEQAINKGAAPKREDTFIFSRPRNKKQTRYQVFRSED